MARAHHAAVEMGAGMLCTSADCCHDIAMWHVAPEGPVIAAYTMMHSSTM